MSFWLEPARETRREERKSTRRRRRPRRAKRPAGPPDPWSSYSVVFREAMRSGFSLDGRPGTPAEWDAQMVRALGPGVSMVDVIKAAKNAVTFTRPAEAFSALRAKWGGN